MVLLFATGGHLSTVLYQRPHPPEKHRWALPGVLVRPDEALDDAAARALADKAGLPGVFLEQLYTFGAPARDPRTRVLSVSYYALCAAERFAPRPGLIAARLEVPWADDAGGPISAIGPGDVPLALAFDHAEIIGLAVKRLRGKLGHAPVGFELLGDTFTLRQLQRMHETVLGRPLNKDSFRRRLLASGLIAPTETTQSSVDHRPARLYRYAG